MPYGVANKTGILGIAQCRAILDMARTAKLDSLDTAISYGQSERRLGEIGIPDWNVTSKLPAIPKNCVDLNEWVETSVRHSLHNLGVDQLYAILLHRSDDLKDSVDSKLLGSLERLKAIGLVRNIGVSIYAPEELSHLNCLSRIDVVQAPYNVLDRRLQTSGWIQRLVSEGIEIQTRSTFLQGALLMSLEDQNAKFRKWEHVWRSWNQWLVESGQTALQACLAVPLLEKEISRIVIGFDGLEQFQQVLDATHAALLETSLELVCCDTDLINPARWNLS